MFIPGTPIWIDAVPIWDGDADWYALLVDQAVVVPGPVTDTLGAAARETGTYLVIGVDEREPHGTTIYNTTLYFGPDGALLGKHRKLMPTGSERTVWGMGDGSTLPVIDTPYGRLSGLTCWENYMPLTRFYLYSQGVDIWTAPTLAGATAGSPPCGTSPSKAAATSSVSTPACTSTRFPPTSRTATGSGAPIRTSGSNPATASSSTRRQRPGRTRTARGDHPVRRHRPRRRAGRPPVLRSGRPLPPPRHLPAPRRHPPPPFGCAAGAAIRLVRTQLTYSSTGSDKCCPCRRLGLG